MPSPPASPAVFWACVLLATCCHWLEVVVVVLVTVKVSVEELLDESLAVTIIVLVPIVRGMEEIDHEVVPETAPQEEPLFVQVMEEMPMLSEAAPETSIVEADVE